MSSSYYYFNKPICFNNASTGFTVSTPIFVVPKLAIPADAYPDHLSKPGRGKDYLCQLCCFSHSNSDLILNHVRRHLDIMVGCPICSRGYQNVVSLHKHCRDTHNIQIVALTTSMQGFVDHKEENLDSSLYYSSYLSAIIAVVIFFNILLITYFVPLHMQHQIVIFLSLIPHGSATRIL